MEIHPKAYVEMAVHNVPGIYLPVTGIETFAFAAALDVA